MKLEYKIGIGAGIILSLIAIAAYASKQAKLLADACSTVSGAIINEISFNKVRFTLILSISNRSDINFSITKQLYNIYVNKMLVARVDNVGKMVVNANGKSSVNINVAFNPQDLLKKGMENIAQLLADKDNMMIEVKGTMSIRSGIVSVGNYEVDERLTLKELLAPSPDSKKC